MRQSQEMREGTVQTETQVLLCIYTFWTDFPFTSFLDSHVKVFFLFCISNVHEAMFPIRIMYRLWFLWSSPVTSISQDMKCSFVLFFSRPFYSFELSVCTHHLFPFITSLESNKKRTHKTRSMKKISIQEMKMINPRIEEIEKERQKRREKKREKKRQKRNQMKGNRLQNDVLLSSTFIFLVIILPVHPFCPVSSSFPFVSFHLTSII